MDKAKVLSLIDQAIEGLCPKAVVSQAKNLETLVHLALELEERDNLELTEDEQFSAGGPKTLDEMSVEELIEQATRVN